jgi:Flp pilus assembly protein TadB
MVLASAYTGGIWYFVQVLRQGRWHRVRNGFPGALLFATLLGVAPVLHGDRFHFGHISFITWATLSLITPVTLPVVATPVVALVGYALLYLYCEHRARRRSGAGAL